MSVGHSTRSSRSQRKSSYVPRAKTPRTCGSCGKAFLGRPDQKWCTRACGAKTRCVPKPPREKVVWPIRTCLACGASFVQTDPRRSTYCSRKCSSPFNAAKAHSPAVQRCLSCGEEFLGFKKNGSYCSDRCKAKADELKSQPKAHVCSQCGKTFLSVRKRRFCSIKCESKNRRPTQSGTVECLSCGKTVNVSSHFQDGRKYCSPKCQKYAARKTGKHRRRVRIKSHPVEIVTIRFLLKRDKNICQLCKKPVNKRAVAPALDSPSIDHVIPLAKGGSHTKANTQLACFGCNTLKGDRVESLF